MTAATYTSDLADIFLFETTTGVSAFGGGASGLGASPDYAVEGTNAVDKQVSASEKGFLFAAASAFAIGPNDHFFIWCTLAVYGLAATRNNRGITVCIGDDTSNFVQFHVNGSDTLPLGGAVPYAVRFVNTALTNRRTLVGTPGTTPDNIGVGANVTGTAKFSNLAADAARRGTGYTILNGTGADPEATFAGIASDDESTAEGIFQTAKGGFSVQGKIRIGQSGTECELTDRNTNLFLVANLDGHVLSDFTEFLVSDDLTIWTLNNVNFITLGTHNLGRLEVLTPLVTAQDETSYDNSPTTEGTFSGGTGHAVSDVITLDDDWTTVTVDAVSGGVVTQFTVNSTFGRSAVAGTTMNQSSTTGSGTGFSLTPDTDNILAVGTVTFTNVGFIDFGETIAGPKDSYTGCRWVNTGKIFANDAAFNDSAVSAFKKNKIVDAQDETSYDNSPTTEGTFAGGTGYAASDTITLSDGTVVTVDAVSAGVVTQFTVDSSGANTSARLNVALTQSSTSGGGSGFTLTPDIDNFRDIAALVWEPATDPDGELDGMTFTMDAEQPTHAIELGVNSPLTMTLRGWTTSGYASANGQSNSTIWVRRTSSTVTINIIGGAGNFSYKSDGATVSIVIDPVTTLVNVKDNSTNANIQNARVLLEAANASGDFPFFETVTITRSASTATVTHTAHGLATNDRVVIRGAEQPEYNGPKQITVTDANTYTYTVSGSPTSPATGRRLAHNQDETSYDNSPTTEGTFTGGTGHAVNDELTMTGDVKVTVDAVSSGVVTQFTVDSSETPMKFAAGDVLVQKSSTGTGTGFTLTPDTDNIVIQSTGAILSGLTDANGNISTSRSFSNPQPVTGFARKSTSSPRYKTSDLGGTISTTTGLIINARLILDE